MAGEAFLEISFSELELCDELKRGIDKCGFEKMTPIQAEAIPVLLSGRDVIGQAQTGTGKTAAFGLPLLEMIDRGNKNLQAVILCPTRELAMQVASEIRNFAVYMQNVKMLPVYGGADIRKQIQGLRGTQIIVGTPGRVMDHMRRHTIKMDNVKLCVLDEADEMLKMGFREDMEFILGAIDHPHQTCLFSATMPQEILDITGRFQNDPKFIKITPKELTIDRIEQFYYAVKREYKTEALVRLMEFYQYKKAIVFCNTKTMTAELASELKKYGYQTDALHGDLSQSQRDIVMAGFRDGTINILTATDIAARGIDVDDVEAVFNYDLPAEIEYYVHRIGRTGRAGRMGTSHTLVKSREFNKLHEIENICHTKMLERKIPSSNAINDSKIRKNLDAAKITMESEGGKCYVDIIKGYCTKHEIDPYEFAAALLKQDIGDLSEEVEINLPSKEKKKRRSDTTKKSGDTGSRKSDKAYSRHENVSRSKSGYERRKAEEKSKSSEKRYSDNKRSDNKMTKTSGKMPKRLDSNGKAVYKKKNTSFKDATKHQK